MRGVCLEYQRLLKAYQHAFVAWVGQRSVHENGADTDLETLEMKYQALTDHEQSCVACLDKLGKEPVQGPDPPVSRERHLGRARAKAS